MRRILQLGRMLLLLTVFLAPIFEFFDRWDALGLNNDTEMIVFCLMLFLSLVPAACTLIRHFTDDFEENSVPIVWPDAKLLFNLDEAFTYIGIY